MAIEVKEWHWEITRKCNLRCKHCLSDCGMPSLRELGTKEVIKSIKSIKSLGCQRVMLTGGEPMCYQGFRAILEECRKQQIFVHFLTNGVFLTSKIIEEISDLVEGVAVSIDGSEQKTNDYIRGNGTFRAATRAIKLLAEKIPVSVFVTASERNLDEVRDIIELSWSLGSSRVHISEINISGRALSNRKIFNLSSIQKLQLKKMALTMTGMYSPIKNCDVSSSVLYISSDGLVYPCIEVALRFPQSFLGDIRSDDLKEDLLGKAEDFFEGGNKAKCCYQIFAGNNLVFCLNARNKCYLIERG